MTAPIPAHAKTSSARRLRILPDNLTVRAGEGEPVLTTLHAAGLAYHVGCRRGGCGVCKVDLLEGEVHYPETVAEKVLSAEERAEGTCLTCRAVPVGDVTISIRSPRGVRVTNSWRLAARRVEAEEGQPVPRRSDHVGLNTANRDRP